ncbi:MAG: hypothetical protein J2P38_08455, partial [Candidatus Dormibacteraeota bacterium]|nr:hypothetical protein [Candidatus Dormibacteraeota bacterium]
MASALGSLSPRAKVLLAALLVVVLAAAGFAGYLALRGHPIGPAPRVEALTTDDGATVSDGDLIPTGTPLRLTFSAAMDRPSVRLLANGSPLGLTWAEDSKSAHLDAGSLHRGRVALSVASGARDTAGNDLAHWDLAFSMVFGVSVHTVPLSAPALI